MAPLTDEQRALAGDPKAVKLALGMADKYALRKGRSQYRDEFRSAALEALCESAARFDPERCEFLGYASVVIWGRLRDCSRAVATHGLAGVSHAIRYGKFETVISTDQRIQGGPAEWRPETYGSQIPSNEPLTAWDTECEEEVRALTRGLGRGGAAIRMLLLRAEFGGEVNRIAEHMGLSPARVSGLLSEAIALMCERAGVEPPDSRRGVTFGLQSGDAKAERKRKWKRERTRKLRESMQASA